VIGSPSRLRTIRKAATFMRLVNFTFIIITGKARATENTYKWVSV
jgi:hypothetical protein